MKVDAGKIVELVRKMKPLFADSSRVSQVEKGTCDYVTDGYPGAEAGKRGLVFHVSRVQFMEKSRIATLLT